MHGQNLLVRLVARDDAGGIVFLDGDLDAEVEIITGICNAKAALSEHGPNPVFSAKDGAACELMRQVDHIASARAAIGAGRICAGELRHAFLAKRLRVEHTSLSPSLF